MDMMTHIPEGLVETETEAYEPGSAPAEQSPAATLERLVHRITNNCRNPLVWVAPFEDGSNRVTVILRDRSRPGFEYDFTCAGFLDAVRWIAHLAEKSWVSKEHLELFAYLVLASFDDSGEVR